MGWLSKFFNAVPADERKGIHLGNDAGWELSATRDMPQFLRALHPIAPAGSVLYLEGGSPTPPIESYLESRKPDQVTKVQMETIWPRPRQYHMVMTNENLEGLAALAEHPLPQKLRFICMSIETIKCC